MLFRSGAIHSGLAMVVTILIPLRKIFRLEDFLTPEHFEYLAKMMILTGLIVGYAYGIEFFVTWYGGNPFEVSTFVDRAFGPNGHLFWAMVTFNCVLPLLFFFRRVRRSYFALTMICVLINVGMWLERFVIIAVSLMNDYLPSTWRKEFHFTWVEIGIMAGSLSWFLLLFCIFAKLFPTVSITEVKEAMPAPTKSGAAALHAEAAPQEGQA